MGDKNPKKQKKKKRMASEINLNQASMKPEPGAEQVPNKRQMKQNRGR
ncbi:hypothetical protein [Lacrimispora sp.]|nr:hypothetical protein [Lacrimispora sp.]